MLLLFAFALSSLCCCVVFVCFNYAIISISVPANCMFSIFRYFVMTILNATVSSGSLEETGSFFRAASPPTNTTDCLCMRFPYSKWGAGCTKLRFGSCK